MGLVPGARRRGPARGLAGSAEVLPNSYLAASLRLDRVLRVPRMAHLRSLLPAFGVVALMAALAPAAQAIDTVKIVNDSGKSPDNVYVNLHGGSSADGQLPADTPKKLSQLSGQQFTLGGANAGLRLFFSYDAPVAFDVDPNVSKTRFDFIELNNFTGGAVADLTSVDWFAIPFKLETLNASGGVVGTLQSPNTDVLLNALSGIAGPGAILKTDSNAFARILAPTKAPSAYPDLTPYIHSLNGLPITIHGVFDPTATTYVYTGTFQANGDITLTGTLSSGGPPKALHIDGSTLPHAAYANTSGVTGNDYTLDGVPHTLTDNDVYAAIYRDIVTGLSLGYIGGKYGNNSDVWYPIDHSRSPDAFAAARTTPPGFVAFDQWADVIGQKSDAYGFPFHDRYQGHSVQLGLNAPATTLRITIKPDQAPSGGDGDGGGGGGGGGSSSAPAAGSAAATPPTEAGGAPLVPAPPLDGDALLDALKVPRVATVARNGSAIVGTATCPPVCGAVRLSATSTAGASAAATKRRPKVLVAGRGATRVATGESRKLVLRLTAKARRLLARKRSLRVALTVSVVSPSGVATRAKRSLTLKRAAR
jgi:hypothetical protein